jgi:hypothetical protein
MSAREATTADCGLPHAPIWAPRGRSAKYSSVSARLIGATTPSTRTCRYSGSQEKTALAYGFTASSLPLRES